MEILFGKGHTLTKTKDLVQPGEHACDETVTIQGPKRAIEKELVTINIHNLRDYSPYKNKQVDDYQFGGGAGMVLPGGRQGRCRACGRAGLPRIFTDTGYYFQMILFLRQ